MGVNLYTKSPTMAIFWLHNGGSTYTRQNTVNVHGKIFIKRYISPTPIANIIPVYFYFFLFSHSRGNSSRWWTSSKQQQKRFVILFVDRFGRWPGVLRTGVWRHSWRDLQTTGRLSRRQTHAWSHIRTSSRVQEVKSGALASYVCSNMKSLFHPYLLFLLISLSDSQKSFKS